MYDFQSTFLDYYISRISPFLVLFICVFFFLIFHVRCLFSLFNKPSFKFFFIFFSSLISDLIFILSFHFLCIYSFLNSHFFQWCIQLLNCSIECLISMTILSSFRHFICSPFQSVCPFIIVAHFFLVVLILFFMPLIIFIIILWYSKGCSTI